MLAEKIKIYVSPHVERVIEKDAEGFEFFKQDGRTLNKNALLTKLVVNYSDDYQQKCAALFSYLKGEISARTRLNEGDLNDLCADISRSVYKFAQADKNEKLTRVLSLKPTRESQPVIDYIESRLLNGSSLSEYFRNMLASYASLPQDEREKIIFKAQAEELQRAIKAKKLVFISTAKGTSFEAAPYALCCSKEEMHCYLLAALRNGCRPIRLSRILRVTPLSENCAFTQKQTELFARMAAYGPQFIYRPGEEEVKIRLTARGADRFKKMYVHRPVPVKIEEDEYTFRCSHDQIVQYFVRFGAAAFVVSPQSVRDKIIAHHKGALARYLPQEGQEGQNAAQAGDEGGTAPPEE